MNKITIQDILLRLPFNFRRAEVVQEIMSQKGHISYRIEELRKLSQAYHDEESIQAILEKENASDIICKNYDLEAATVETLREWSAWFLFKDLLSSADLSGIDFAGCDLRGANLEETDLSRCDLRGADLSFAVLNKTMLSGADMQRTKLRTTLICDSDLSHCNLSYAEFDGAIIRDSTLDYADLRFALFRGTETDNTNMNHCKSFGMRKEYVMRPVPKSEGEYND